MKDERLYMRFPIILDEDPAIEVLSDAAFRAFIEMNGYSRRNDLDGRIPERAAVKRWGGSVLAEIVAAREESPYLVIEGGCYVLTKYAKHQQTTADRADLASKRARAGRQGADKTNGKRAANAASLGAASDAAKSGKRSAESESESESELDTQRLLSESLDPAARETTPAEIASVREVISESGGDRLDDLGVAVFIDLLLEASPRPVVNVAGYVRRSLERSPRKVEGLVAEAGRQAGRVRS